MNIEQQIKEYTLKLQEYNKEFKKLEKEKQYILKSLDIADEKTKDILLKKMAASKEKYQKLCDDMFELAKKVKELKNQALSLPST